MRTVTVRHKLWINVAQSLVFLFIGMNLLGVFVAIAFYGMKDVHGQPSDDAAMPCLIFGSITLIMGIMFGVQLFLMLSPLIVADEHGMTIRLIGRGKHDRWILLPAMIRILLSVITGSGFGIQIYHAVWTDIQSIQVIGMTALQRLAIAGSFCSISTSETTSGIQIVDANIKGDLRDIQKQLTKLQHEMLRS